MPTAPARSPESQARFEELRDFILEYHGARSVAGARVIGRTPEGLAVALICEDPAITPQRDVLTQNKLDRLLNEVRILGLNIPAEIWAAGSVAPQDERLYRLYQLAMWPPPLPELLMVKMHITPEHYARLRNLDDGRRASLITFTHHSQEMIGEDDLLQALTDAHAAAGRTGPPPMLGDAAATEILLRLLQQAAAGWQPRTPASASLWSGSKHQAVEFLAKAAGANPNRTAPT